MSKHIGKFVFLERVSDDGKGMDYYTGEYLCLKETPHALYCCKPTSGYNGHELKSFCLVGNNPWKVISAKTDLEAMRRLAKEQREWGELPEGKRQYIKSCHDDSLRNARLMEEILAEAGECGAVQVPVASGKIVVEVRVVNAN